MPVDAPLYSKSTDLPIFRTSDGLPIFGDPANCGCCGGGGPQFDSGCGNCPDNTTPLALEITFSGVTACTFCSGSLWAGPGDFWWKPKSALNSTYQLTRDATDKCLYTAETTWTWEKYDNDADWCEGTYLGDFTSPCYISVRRINATQWRVEVMGQWPDAPAGPYVTIFYATATADCDASWVVSAENTICYWTIPQNTVAFINGTASAEPA